MKTVLTRAAYKYLYTGACWSVHRLLMAVAGVAITAASASAQDIVVGQIGSFTMNTSPASQDINKGAKAYFAQINARGGVNGRKVSFFELDDKYNPEEFIKQLEVAMQRKPVALLSPLGSVTMQKVLQDKLLDKYDTLIINVVPGAEVLREPGHPRLFHVRAGDRQQLQKIVQHARALGITRIHVLHQNIPIGTSGLTMVKDEAASGQGAPLTIRAAAASLDDHATIAAAAKQVTASDSQSVIAVGTPKFMADAITELRRSGVKQQIFALSYLQPEVLAKVAGEEAARGVGIAQTYPNPMGNVVPLQREFSAAMKAFDPALTNYTASHMEGYIVARVFVEGARRAGTDVRPESLARALRTGGPMDFSGFRVDFSKNNLGSSFVDIGVVTSGGRLRY